jgi:DNA-binding NtrC family response regulator
MKRKNKIVKTRKKKTILLHSADKDMAKSLSILLQDQYGIVVTESVEELALQRKNKYVSLLVVDLERSIPLLLTEFELRHQEQSNAPIIVLYAFRQGQPEWEKRIRSLADQVLYKPVQIEQILDAIATNDRLIDGRGEEVEESHRSHRR